MANLTIAPVAAQMNLDAHDVVDALENNDESILAFVIEMLEKAESSDLRERLSERLASWEEDHREG